jgi:hypothetical protein
MDAQWRITYVVNGKIAMRRIKGEFFCIIVEQKSNTTVNEACVIVDRKGGLLLAAPN